MQSPNWKVKNSKELKRSAEVVQSWQSRIVSTKMLNIMPKECAIIAITNLVEKAQALRPNVSTQIVQIIARECAWIATLTLETKWRNTTSREEKLNEIK